MALKPRNRLPQAILMICQRMRRRRGQIRTADDRLRMQFTPKVRGQHVNLGLLANDFTQPFGAFRRRLAR